MTRKRRNTYKNIETPASLTVDSSNQLCWVWFQLVDFQGNSIGTQKVKLTPSSDVAELILAVHELFSGNYLKDISPFDLLVYQSKQVFQSDKKVLSSVILLH